MNSMNPLENLISTINFDEPERIPVFLTFTTHGAKELHMSIRDYFSDSENIAKGQLLLQEKFGHDCLYAFTYAALEIEAFGGSVIYYDDGPPNSGAPIVRDFSRDIPALQPPDVYNSPPIMKLLNAIKIMKEAVGDRLPIIGVVMAPFSLPVMQLGFDKYIELIYSNNDLFEKLMEINKKFCIDFANAQIEMGANVIVYFDPLSNITMFPLEMLENTGFFIARETISKINGIVAIHLASGIAGPNVDNLIETGAKIIGIAAGDNVEKLMDRYYGRISFIGNLNGIEMIHWTEQQCETIVRDLISEIGHNGGFIISDHHGEIPYHVPDNILLKIVETVKKYGTRPN